MHPPGDDGTLKERFDLADFPGQIVKKRLVVKEFD